MPRSSALAGRRAAARDLPPVARAPLLALGFVALVVGIAGGLVRLGFALPAPAAGVAWHGAFMASAFFGTLIALERAVAIGRVWAYGAPAASGAGGIVLLTGDARAAFALLVLGAALLMLASLAIYLRQRALHTAVLLLGATALLVANVALAAGTVPDAIVPCWIAFLVLTIGGERLELCRLAPVPRGARRAFGALAAGVLASAWLALWWFDVCLRINGVLLVAMGLWLIRYDIATRTVRTRGLTRYIALCLLAGYAWLVLAGVVLAATPFLAGATQWWDAALHAVFLGFVFSMVFGHAPVIVPAVLRAGLPYRSVLYLPLGLLHASVALRVAGDFGAGELIRDWGGAGNALAIAVFVVTAAALALGAGRVRRAG